MLSDLTDPDEVYGDRAGDSEHEWATTGRAEPAEKNPSGNNHI
jgi:hypothetical protein